MDRPPKVSGSGIESLPATQGQRWASLIIALYLPRSGDQDDPSSLNSAGTSARFRLYRYTSTGAGHDGHKASSHAALPSSRSHGEGDGGHVCRNGETGAPGNRSEFIAAMRKVVRVDKIEEIAKRSMLKTFTTDELNALADFYSSKDGASAMKKLGVYMGDIMPPLMQEIERGVQEI